MRQLLLALSLLTWFSLAVGAEVDPRLRPATPGASQASSLPFRLQATADPASAEPVRTVPSRSGTSVGRLLGRFVPDENVRNHISVRSAFREIVEPASQATVRVLCDDVQASLGVVIHADGYVLTKASELQGKKLDCVLVDQRRLPAVRVAGREDLDLAILKIRATGLTVIRWSNSPAPTIGSWLATATISGEPAAVGVVSTAVHESPAPTPSLGVRYEPREDGILVVSVSSGSGAARAGLRRGDRILSANGTRLMESNSLRDVILSLQPGDQLKLAVQRDSETLDLVATLGDGSRPGQPEQVELMDSLGGPLSRRRAGFPSVLQHDTVLRPRDCGGPVIDLDGNVVGLNIARVSRVATYALPSEVVRSAIVEMLTTTLVNTGTGNIRPVAQHP